MKQFTTDVNDSVPNRTKATSHVKTARKEEAKTGEDTEQGRPGALGLSRRDFIYYFIY